MKRILTFIVIILILLIATAATYWYYLFYVPAPHVTVTAGNGDINGFAPLNSNNAGSQNSSNTNAVPPNTLNVNNSPATAPVSSSGLPVLRLYSNAPIGGYGLSKTATSTNVRWVDRGRGNIYESNSKSAVVNTLSNTLVPRIYQSWWGKDLTAFIAQYVTDSSDTVTTVIANLIKNTAVTTSTSSNQITETPYQLKGKMVSGNITAIAVSPNKDRLLFVTNDNNRSIGFISKFDGSGQTQVFNIPLTQITVDWPEDNTLAVSTKASASYAGFLYFINIKTGEMKSILSNIPGLSAKVSRDASHIFYSRTGAGNNHINNSILDVKTGKTADVIFKTLADKCVWSAKSKQIIYCGVASQLFDGTYPDDWYMGKMSFADNIWQLDTSSNQARQIANPLTQANALIDSINLELDPNDEYLYFMNKNDLSLWSLDLASTN
jgi:hypothetical protein